MLVTETSTAGEAAVAQKALLEVSRLVGEATERFERESFIEAMSSLTAVTTVLDPLIGFMNRSWVSAAAGDDPGAFVSGQYL